MLELVIYTLATGLAAFAAGANYADRKARRECAEKTEQFKKLCVSANIKAFKEGYDAGRTRLPNIFANK